jgi:hypothetical protein
VFSIVTAVRTSIVFSADVLGVRFLRLSQCSWRFKTCEMVNFSRRSFYPSFLTFKVKQLGLFEAIYQGTIMIGNASDYFNPLTPELNPSVQRCLKRFLLRILLLETCISLIYA